MSELENKVDEIEEAKVEETQKEPEKKVVELDANSVTIAKSSSSKLMMGIIIVLLVSIIAILLVLVFKPKDESKSEVLNPDAVKNGAAPLTYQEGVVATDADTLQDQVDKMMQQVEEGQMGLEMKVSAVSTDGENFSCYLGNAASNKYDMYMAIYTDAECTDQLLLTGLIPVGSRMESFKISRKLEPGEYECYLVYTQVEDDHATIHANVVVTISLIVSEA